MAYNMIKMSLFLVLVLALISIAVSAFFYWTQRPSNDRQWAFGQQRLPSVEIVNDRFKINNLRDYAWHQMNDSEPANEQESVEQYRDIVFKLSDIQALEVGVSHFSVHQSIAHVFLVFKVNGQPDIGLSIEARRSIGEDYAIWGGLTFAYDLAYFLTTKRDLLAIRQQRNEKVYVYPTVASPQIAQQLFQRLAHRVNELATTPEFYHILFKNCAGLVVTEVEQISPLNFPFYEKTFAPGFTGKVLFDMGLLQTQATDFATVQQDSLVKF